MMHLVALLLTIRLNSACLYYHYQQAPILHYQYQTYPLSGAFFNRLTAIPGVSLWQGYASRNPLGMSGKEHLVARVDFFLSRNRVNGRFYANDYTGVFFYQSDRPNKIDVLAYGSLQYAYDDASHRHYGMHLCADMEIGQAQFLNWITAVKASVSW